MKKIKANLLVVLSLLIGGGIGYMRGDIFYKHYDGYTGVVLSSANLSIGIMTGLIILFASLGYLFTKNEFSRSRLSHKLRLIDKILILVGMAVILVSAFLGFTSYGAGFFEKTFAISAIVAAIYFLLALVPVRNAMSDLLSCAVVLPAVLILLSIYRNNIRFPNISLFAFEVLAALFIMLGFYFISASNFKKVSGNIYLWMISLAVLFSAASIVSHYYVVKYYLFQPVMADYTSLYFIGSFLVLLGFSSSLIPLRSEKVLYEGGEGFVITAGETAFAFDKEYNAKATFYSKPVENPEVNSVVTGDDSHYMVNDLQVSGFAFDGEKEAYGQIIITPSGKTLLNLTQADSAMLSDKLIKDLSYDAGNVDYIIINDREDASAVLSLVTDKIKHKNILLLTTENDMETVAKGKTVFTQSGQFTL